MLKTGEGSNRDKTTCIIIGGGISGLIAATVLQRQNISVTVLDKGRGIGGRLATRRINDGDTKGIFDYGTQYFSVKQPEFQTWVDDWLQQGVIKEWCRGFGTDDGKPRYCGVKGTRGIAQHLAQDLDVRTSTRVIKLNREQAARQRDRYWQVFTANEEFHADILVITSPIPQSLTLLKDSQIALSSDVQTALEQISYHPCIAVLALLDEPSSIPSPGGFAPEDESLVWLASNYQKGISPNGYAVTLHGTPEFSAACWDNSDAEIAQRLFAAAAPWLTSVTKYQVHRWRYSLPKTFYSEPCLHLPKLSLTMAGDAFVAPKLEGAVLSGMAVEKAVSSEQ